MNNFSAILGFGGASQMGRHTATDVQSRHLLTHSCACRHLLTHSFACRHLLTHSPCTCTPYPPHARVETLLVNSCRGLERRSELHVGLFSNLHRARAKSGYRAASYAYSDVFRFAQSGSEIGVPTGVEKSQTQLAVTARGPNWRLCFPRQVLKDFSNKACKMASGATFH